jgi:hypothetical protein
MEGQEGGRCLDIMLGHKDRVKKQAEVVERVIDAKLADYIAGDGGTALRCGDTIALPVELRMPREVLAGHEYALAQVKVAVCMHYLDQGWSIRFSDAQDFMEGDDDRACVFTPSTKYMVRVKKAAQLPELID